MNVDCHKCEHYYVTWDKDFPHGCRAMGFKGKQMPIVAVRSSTPAIECLSFKKRKKRREPTE